MTHASGGRACRHKELRKSSQLILSSHSPITVKHSQLLEDLADHQLINNMGCGSKPGYHLDSPRNSVLVLTVGRSPGPMQPPPVLLHGLARPAYASADRVQKAHRAASGQCEVEVGGSKSKSKSRSEIMEIGTSTSLRIVVQLIGMDVGGSKAMSPDVSTWLWSWTAIPASPVPTHDVSAKVTM